MIVVEIIRSSVRYVSIGAAFHDSDGALTDPTSPTVQVLRVTPGTGARVAIAGSPFTLTKVNPPNLTGMYAVSIDIDGLSEGQYECFVRGDVGGNVGGTVVNFMISAPLDDILTDTAAIPTAAAIADQVWEEAAADHSGTGGSTAEMLANIETQVLDINNDIGSPSVTIADDIGAVKDWVGDVREATYADNGTVLADGANSASYFKTDLNNGAADVYNGHVVTFWSGALAGEVRRIVGYSGGAWGERFVTVSPAFSGTPSATDQITLRKEVAEVELLVATQASIDAIEIDTNAIQSKLPASGDNISDFDFTSDNVSLTVSVMNSIADKVWQELMADHSGGAGSTAEALAAILIDTAAIQPQVAVLPSAAAIADAVLDEAMSGHTTVGTLGKFLSEVHQIETGRWKIDENTNTMIFYDTDGTTPLRTYDLKDVAGAASSVNVHERVPA